MTTLRVRFATAAGAAWLVPSALSIVIWVPEMARMVRFSVDPLVPYLPIVMASPTFHPSISDSDAMVSVVLPGLASCVRVVAMSFAVP